MEWNVACMFLECNQLKEDLQIVFFWGLPCQSISLDSVVYHYDRFSAHFGKSQLLKGFKIVEFNFGEYP